MKSQPHCQSAPAEKHSASPGSSAPLDVILAQVVDVGPDRRVQLRRLDGPSALVPARFCVERSAPAKGARVLAALGASDAEQAVVFAVVDPPESSSVQAADGATASLEQDAIVLRDPSGQAIVSYAPSTGLRLCAPEGDLELAAPHGRVRIEAAELVTRVGRWELRAERIVESATDAYREVRGLAQTRAGRIRNLVTDAYQLVAGRTAIVSDEDTVVDGKRVLLG